MQGTVETRLFRLVDSRNMTSASIGHLYPQPPSWLEAELIGEEYSKLTPISEAVPTSKRTENLTGLFSAEQLGYLPPARVRRYFLRELNREFEGSPQLEVEIYFPGDRTGNQIGEYRFFHPEKFLYEDMQINYNVLSGHVLDGNRPDTMYIKEDLSGMFIPITREMIGGLIGEAVKQTDEAGVIRSFWEEKIGKARKLAEAGEFPDLAEQINAAEQRCEQLVAGAPQKYRKLLEQRSVFTGTPRYKVELSGDLPQSWELGITEYNPANLSRAIVRDREAGGVDSKNYPFSLESVSTLGVIDLMKHFAQEGHDLEYIRQHIKIEKLN